MTEMILKWNPNFEKYGAIYHGEWYKKWLPTQQKMAVDGFDCTLQFQPGSKLNHGFYITSNPEKLLDGLKVDLPLDPHVVRNIVY